MAYSQEGGGGQYHLPSFSDFEASHGQQQQGYYPQQQQQGAYDGYSGGGTYETMGSGAGGGQQDMVDLSSPRTNRYSDGAEWNPRMSGSAAGASAAGAGAGGAAAMQGPSAHDTVGGSPYGSGSGFDGQDDWDEDDGRTPWWRNKLALIGGLAALVLALAIALGVGASLDPLSYACMISDGLDARSGRGAQEQLIELELIRRRSSVQLCYDRHHLSERTTDDVHKHVVLHLDRRAFDVGQRAQLNGLACRHG